MTEKNLLLPANEARQAPMTCLAREHGKPVPYRRFRRRRASMPVAARPRRPRLAGSGTALTVSTRSFPPSAKLKVPAGKALKLTVNNLDATPEEFESYPLQFEKVIAGNQSAVIRIRPLTEGTYDFFGEYHEDTAQGAVVVE